MHLGDEPLTIATAIRDAESKFAATGIDASRVAATALLEHVLAIDRAQLLARFAEPLPLTTLTAYGDLVARRLAREPLQYIIGTAHFLDFALHVESGVFIPRPETEELVTTALAAWDPGHPWAIDLCCGSGAIAVALARARGGARLLAIDRAPTPRRVTRTNAARLGVGERVDVVGSDLLAAVPASERLRERLGAIVCNPPYAATGEVEQPEVLHHEPLAAIESGPQGTEIYARVIPAAATLLLPGRPLLFELGYGRADAVLELLARDDRWANITIDDDFQGIPRVLTAYRR